MQTVIITGLSGAGKSQAVNAFEDIGYYCIDNLPPALIPRFAEMAAQLNKDGDIAIVCDARTGELFKGLLAAMEELRAADMPHKILFLDCEDAELVRRYRESRRKHPLAEGDSSIAEAISREREILRPVEELAEYRINTTHMLPQQLKENIISMFLSDGNVALRVRCLSFGFKHGLPAESDLVLDVRFLPNPFYIDSLKKKTGLDAPVYSYVMDHPSTTELLMKYCDLLAFLLPQYRDEGKSQLVIAIGCTGGRHRSVAIAKYLSEYVLSLGFKCSTFHRDIAKGN